MDGFTGKSTILITGETFITEVRRDLQKKGFEVELCAEHLTDVELGQALQGKNAYILGGIEFASEAALSSATELRIIAVMGVGFEAFVDVAAATRRGIAVTNTPHANSRSVAEMTIGMAIALRRKIPYIGQLTKSGHWRNDIVTKDLKDAALRSEEHTSELQSH